MKTISNNTLKICAALALSALAPIATAQPISKTNPQLGVAVVAGADAKPLLTLQASETSAAALLSVIAARTGAKIIVKNDAPIGSLEIKRAPLADAIAQIAKAAHLKLEMQETPGMEAEVTYVVSELETGLKTKKPANALDIDFKEIPVSQLIKILNDQFNVEARVDPTVPEKNIDIIAFNVTAIEALQTIADAADLEVSQTAGGYVLRERAAKKLDLTFKDVPVVSFFRTLAEQFGVEVRLAPELPDKLVDLDVTNMTPEEALRATAKAADFEISEVDGVYFVRERAATAK